jgi:NADH:ubiquinone oxidoreductase subunit 2 (subunit N)
MGLNSPAFVVQVVLAIASMLLCLASVVTSRSKRHQHRSYLRWAILLIALAVLVWFQDLAVKLFGEIEGDPDDWLLFLMGLVIVVCTVPIWRSVQSSRMREKASRYRKAGSAVQR